MEMFFIYFVHYNGTTIYIGNANSSFFPAEADLWEKVADRNHSLATELGELRHLLVNWRKMEVMCWDNLLEQVQVSWVSHLPRKMLSRYTKCRTTYTDSRPSKKIIL